MSCRQASSVIRLLTDVLSPISVVSHDPVNADTAYGLLADLLTAVRGDGRGVGGVSHDCGAAL